MDIGKQKMIDYHIHFGSYNSDVRYESIQVFSALKTNHVSECWCAFLTPKLECASDSLDFYFYSLKEQEKARKESLSMNLLCNFLFWIDPLLLSKERIESLYGLFPYKGIAIHPFHNWSNKTLNEVCMFASFNRIPLFIHTGTSEYEHPSRFVHLIDNYKSILFHLAHCKEPEPIIKIFEKNTNVCGDVAFCSKESYREICQRGFRERMRFGTDFPITHWYEQERKQKHYSTDELANSYKKTIEKMTWFNNPDL